jgi:hypothetical protein
MASRTFETVTSNTVWLVAAAIVTAVVLGALVAIQPGYAAAGVGVVIGAVPVLLLFRNVGKSLLAEHQGAIIQVSLVVLLASLVRKKWIVREDLTAARDACWRMCTGADS